ncbi:MAG: hypothetical protein HYR94_28010, partial [Chloroflexi bacterium]|nr:hypothetical protein [Chloroflexota bacterium]
QPCSFLGRRWEIEQVQIEEQEAQYGVFDVPLELQNKIEATKSKIEEIKSELEDLSGI